MDVIIIGGQKCGTTALFTFLSRHPQIKPSIIKEIDFFSYQNNFSKSYLYYESLFPKVFFKKKRKLKFMEASPSYILDEDPYITAKRIFDFNPRAKLILLVRDPVKRAFSAWQMYKKRYLAGNAGWWVEWVKFNKPEVEIDRIIRRTPEEYQNFEFFLRREQEALKNNEIIECPVLNLGLYAKGLKEYLKVFPKEQISVVKNEEMMSDTSKTLTHLSEYLELKKINWTKYNNKKIFEGGYKIELTQNEIIILNEFYRSATKELWELTGVLYT